MTIPFIAPDVKPSVNELRLDLAFFFPELTHFYGYAAKPDHNTRRCLDAMVYDSSKKYVAQQGRNNLGYNDRIALGNRVLAFLRENAKHYGLNGVIWNRKVYGFPHDDAPFGRNFYRGPYNVARNYTISAHDDHLHIDQDGSTFKPLRDIGAPFPLGTVWVDVLVPGVTNSISIRLVQRALEVEQTGTWDAATLAAAKAYQASLGDTVQDGLLGPKQVTKLFADKKMSVTIRLDASGQAPKPPVVKPDPKPEPSTVDVTWLNNNQLQNSDQRSPWVKREAGLADFYVSSGASLFTWQEIDPDATNESQLVPVVRRMGAKYWWDRGGPNGCGWDNDLWEFEADKSFTKKLAHLDGTGVRYLHVVRLIHRATGKGIWLGSTHLNHKTTAAASANRSKQAREVAGYLKPLIATGDPVFLGGDFNDSGVTSGEPKGILKAAGLQLLSEQTGVVNRKVESHHGLAKPNANSKWIDDECFANAKYVKGRQRDTYAKRLTDHNAQEGTYRI